MMELPTLKKKKLWKLFSPMILKCWSWTHHADLSSFFQQTVQICIHHTFTHILRHWHRILHLPCGPLTGALWCVLGNFGTQRGHCRIITDWNWGGQRCRDALGTWHICASTKTRDKGTLTCMQLFKNAKSVLSSKSKKINHTHIQVNYNAAVPEPISVSDSSPFEDVWRKIQYEKSWTKWNYTNYVSVLNQTKAYSYLPCRRRSFTITCWTRCCGFNLDIIKKNKKTYSLKVSSKLLDCLSFL